MTGRPPWWQRRGPLAWALLPMGIVYAGLDALNRALTRGRRANLPTVCIGNFTAGGAGKTPVTQALARLLVDQGVRIAIVSRGYGADAQGGGMAPIRVDAAQHTARQVGDEPLLLARTAPTYVGVDRHASIDLAKSDGAEMILLDDGLQHHRLIPDVRVEVRNGADGLGNGFPLPAGPLRQWFGLASADVQIVIGLDAMIRASLPEGLSAGVPVRAFCGIADPRKFWATLDGLGLPQTQTWAYPDHHIFSDSDHQRHRDWAAQGPTVTTQKDWVRLPQDLQAQIHAIPYSVEFADPDGILRAVRQGQQRHI